MEEGTLETDIDQLLNLLKKEDKLPLEQVASRLNVSMDVVQTWVDFLVEEGIIGVEYKFTKPFIFIIRDKKDKIEEKEEYTWDTFKNDFYLDALEKNISEDKIAKLWVDKIITTLEEKREFFLLEAHRRGIKKAEELWEQYTGQRKSGGDFKSKDQVSFEEFVIKDIVIFLDEQQNIVRGKQSVREEESPLLYTGKDFKKDLEIAIAANDLVKAKSIFDVCKAEYTKASGEKKQELFKVLNELYSRIKECLKNKKKQSLEGEISTLEEEGVLHPKEEKVFSGLFTKAEIRTPKIEVKSVQPIQTGWAAEGVAVSRAEPVHIESEEHKTRMRAEKLMEDKIKEKINESCGIIKLALEKKDLHRAILEYNKLKETYSLIPSVLLEEKSAIYGKIVGIFKNIKKIEQDRLLTKLSGPAQHQLTEEELVDKIAVGIDRTQAFILNKELQKAVEQYQEVNEWFDLLPQTMPEIKKRFLIDLARLYHNLQSLNTHLQSSSKNLFDHQPGKVLPKYAPDNPLETVRRSISKIERYLQAGAIKSGMLEFNKIKTLCEHLPPTSEAEKKELFEEIKGMYNKIESARKEHAPNEPVTSLQIVDMKASEDEHLAQVKEVHEEIKRFYADVTKHKTEEARARLMDIQHKITLLEDERERQRLLGFIDQLCHKTHFAEQEDKLNTSQKNGRT